MAHMDLEALFNLVLRTTHAVNIDVQYISISGVIDCAPDGVFLNCPD